MPSNEESSNVSPKVFQRHGLRWNGTYIPWPVVGTLILLVFDAGIKWETYRQLVGTVTEVRRDTAELDDETNTAETARSVLHSRMTTVESVLRDHRYREHD